MHNHLLEYTIERYFKNITMRKPSIDKVVLINITTIFMVISTETLRQLFLCHVTGLYSMNVFSFSRNENQQRFLYLMLIFFFVDLP